MDELFRAISDNGIPDVLLEKRVGLARGAMAKYRRGVQPSLATFRAICNAVGLDVEIVRR